MQTDDLAARVQRLEKDVRDLKADRKADVERVDGLLVSTLHRTDDILSAAQRIERAEQRHFEELRGLIQGNFDELLKQISALKGATSKDDKSE